MKVVAFNGSARKGGNTAILLGHVLGELANEGIETELAEHGRAQGDQRPLGQMIPGS
jgi:multimeric flavodoxin WrbA